MFNLNMFVIALFTSDVSFKHVSSIVVNLGFALQCCMLISIVLRQCSPKYSAFYPSPIIALYLIIAPILVLSGTRLLSASIRHFEHVWSDHD